MREENFINWILTNLKKQALINRDYSFKLFEQSDKIVVWLVGFSVTSIILTISKLGGTNSFVNEIMNYVILFGSLNIIFGILYRIFLFLFQTRDLKLMNDFNFFVDGYTMPSEHKIGRDINVEDTYQDVIRFLKEDYNISLNVKDDSKLNSTEKEKLRNEIIDFYDKTQDEKLVKQTEELKKIISEQFGYSPKKLNKAFDVKKNNGVIWIYANIVSVTFILSILSFLLGILFIMIYYFKYYG